ncbi:hypothetical protein D0T49_10590 [Paludibacter sp. 221]|uniref:hypothetical protein n=1 Tax=Paludibacter sp. 221 TaxID=2302939 RepID=UPI0013D49153|nr:hypothetical protein [Paludibacter sp. 221]NDV47493.1 hypothetical protein [Paludibacter sp. 221]
MKSDKEALKSRGFVEKQAENEYSVLSFDEKTELLKSSLPTDRTIGARLLRSEEKAIPLLIEALKKEKKLYTKIEICDTLASYGTVAVQPLIDELGKIGNNQHKTVPQERFNKKSYPLLRDISARTLVNIGSDALPALLHTLGSKNMAQLSEAIDTIGYICFYNRTAGVFGRLMQCFDENRENDLIRWKIMRAMSALPESKDFLQTRLQTEKNAGIVLEIQRSLSLI